MVRVFVFSPTPHFLEHFPHGFHFVGTQSIGHGNTLHFLLLDRGGHFEPFTRTVRARRCVPPPQSFEQLSYGPHLATTHFFEVLQGALLQAFFISRNPHFFPPETGFEIILLCLVREPPPHLREHSEKGDHRPILQSFLHGAVLHGRFSFRIPHSRSSSSAKSRSRIFVPPPHFFEHFLQACHGCSLHGCAQGLVLHIRCWVKKPHSRPPSSGFTRTLRCRFCIPPSHFWEHGRNLDHADSLQWMGQSILVQALL